MSSCESPGIWGFRWHSACVRERFACEHYVPIGVRAGLEVGDGVKLKILERAVCKTRPFEQQSKHIHLIGICGTAMAPLAGMLRNVAFALQVGCRGVSADVDLS